MNRLALLAFVVLVGCSKASAPEPSLPPPSPVVEAKPALPVAPPEEVTPLPDIPVPDPKFERFDYKGQVPGEFTIEAFSKLHPDATEQATEAEGITHWKLSRGAGLTIANAPVNSASYLFLDGKLLQITLYCLSDGPQVLNALREKYGPADSTEEAVEYWHAKEGTLSAQTGAKNGLIVNFDNKALAEEAFKRRQQKKGESTRQNAKDL